MSELLQLVHYHRHQHCYLAVVAVTSLWTGCIVVAVIAEETVKRGNRVINWLVGTPTENDLSSCRSNEIVIDLPTLLYESIDYSIQQLKSSFVLA